MPAYLAHDFAINCPWTLPEGVIALPSQAEFTGIWVEEGTVAWQPDPDGAGEQFHLEQETSSFFWTIFGQASVHKSGRVIVQPHAHAPAGIIPHAILGPICAHWILLSGNIPLHANCVSIDGELVAFVGASGAGKSSLAAALVAHGAVPHADDVVSLAPTTARVPFGAARIKLNADISSALRLQPLGSSAIYEGLDKRSVYFATPDDVSTRPLKAIYRLHDTVEQTRFAEVSKFPVAMAILSEFYRPHVAEATLGFQTMLNRAASLVGKVQFFDLYRKKDLKTIDQLALSVIEHFQALN